MEKILDKKYKMTEHFYEYSMQNYFSLKNEHYSLTDFKTQYIDNLFTINKPSFGKDYDELVFFLEKINENAGDLFSYYHIPQKIFENGYYYLTKELITPIQEHDLKTKFLVYKIQELNQKLKTLQQENDALKQENDVLKEENKRILQETQLESKNKKK